MPYSLPIISIPLYCMLALYPHVYAITISNEGDPTRYDNRNPRSTQQIDKLRKLLSPQKFAAYERAERCHANSMENMPLFIAATLTGVMAEQKQALLRLGDRGVSLKLNQFVVAWLVVRALYTFAYIRIDSQGLSYVRSVCFTIGLALCFTELVQAAKALA